MKQNKYDDNTFFEKYSNMGRSKNGLEGAEELLNSIPEMSDELRRPMMLLIASRKSYIKCTGNIG